jgi:hypothetical protein
MNCHRHFVEITLELKSGGLDELFVFGIVRNRGQVLGDIDVAHPAQVGVDVAICPGKQARRFGWRMFAELNHHGECSQENQQTEQNWEPSPETHRGMGKNDSIRR